MTVTGDMPAIAKLGQFVGSAGMHVAIVVLREYTVQIKSTTIIL